ncbi:MAG TPA: LysM peptidoglycan-binding domain-containing protein [Aggregatilineales bacterium]|nr:LysM peptidoglycan-binding domain-containing protein [Aggregatilineales bacterium]
MNNSSQKLRIASGTKEACSIAAAFIRGPLALAFTVLSTLACAIGSPGLTGMASTTTAVSLAPTADETLSATQDATQAYTAPTMAPAAPTEIPTNTFIPPSLTYKSTIPPTNTLLPSWTSTLPPALNLSSAMVATETSQPSSAVSSPTPCTQNKSWLPYTIQSGDTLSSISVRAGITLQELQTGNCIADPNAIVSGKTLLVPQSLSQIALPTTFYAAPNSQAAVPPAASSQNVAPCPDADAEITSPASGSTFSGKLTLVGSANIPNFSYYVIDYRFYTEWDHPFNSFFNNYTRVVNGVLAVFDPAPGHLPPGGYTLRLRVYNTSGYGPAPCAISVTLQ